MIGNRFRSEGYEQANQFNRMLYLYSKRFSHKRARENLRHFEWLCSFSIYNNIIAIKRLLYGFA